HASLSFFSPSIPPPPLHSFPTRRSSDLDGVHRFHLEPGPAAPPGRVRRREILDHHAFVPGLHRRVEHRARVGGADLARDYVRPRSEEHTSELQSLRHLVCRLLLEKKKKN